MTELNVPKNTHTHHWTVGGVTFTVRTWDRDSDYRQGEALFVEYQASGEAHPFTHIPYEDDPFCWLARRFAKDSWTPYLWTLVGGEALPIARSQLRCVDTLRLVGPIWCPVANIVQERSYGPGGAEARRGTKHFQPGAKVYVTSRLGHFKDLSVEVIGRHRAPHRFVTMVVRASWLTRWRVELVYSPHVIEQISWGTGGTEADRIYYEDWIKPFAERSS